MADDLRTKEIQSRLKFFHQIGFRRLNVMNSLDIRRALQNALSTHAGYTVEAVLSDLVASGYRITEATVQKAIDMAVEMMATEGTSLVDGEALRDSLEASIPAKTIVGEELCTGHIPQAIVGVTIRTDRIPNLFLRAMPATAITATTAGGRNREAGRERRGWGCRGRDARRRERRWGQADRAGSGRRRGGGWLGWTSRRRSTTSTVTATATTWGGRGPTTAFWRTTRTGTGTGAARDFLRRLSVP